MASHNTIFADLSSNNGSFDAHAYKEAGHVIVALKASEGVGWADPTHRGRCLAAGLNHIAVIHYHFGRPDSHPGAAGGKAEAEWFLHACAHLLGPHDYVCYDGERASNGAFGLDPDHCRGFDEYIQKTTRYKTILYASASMLTAHGEHALVGKNKRDWCAMYSSAPDVAAPGHKCVMRQFTDGVLGPQPHVVAGIGRCDVDIMRGEFASRVLHHAK